jgi:HAD superfamily 5'-nucleotidase-like hydrolase
MDHTLAVYKEEPLESLAFDATREKLIMEKGYPDSIRSFQYKPQLIIRGLVVDKRRGNILKTDQYNYVVRVYHGTRRLSKDERKALYRNRRVRLSSPKYMSIDTLFGLPEATLFALLVDHFEELEGRPRRDYTSMYDDVRECIDRAHADDTIKRQIVAAPDRHIVRDAGLPRTLEAFRDQGKKLFLLTNSEPYYTHLVMTFLLDGAIASFPHWHDFFDIIVVNAGKPDFFRRDETPRPLSAAALRAAGMDSEAMPPVYEGGGGRGFERLAAHSGDEILYIGDHTFGDILRAKELSRWRTAMVIQELEHEIECEGATMATHDDLGRLVAARGRLTAQIARVRRRLQAVRHGEQPAEEFAEEPGSGRETADPSLADSSRRLEERLVRLQDESARHAREIRTLREQIDATFNPRWGKLFKCGEINSRFGHQVKDFACVYTSAVRNFLEYPEGVYFRSPREIMPHEMGLDRG